jgi:hypothetical protein
MSAEINTIRSGASSLGNRGAATRVQMRKNPLSSPQLFQETKSVKWNKPPQGGDATATLVDKSGKFKVTVAGNSTTPQVQLTSRKQQDGSVAFSFKDQKNNELLAKLTVGPDGKVTLPGSNLAVQTKVGKAGNVTTSVEFDGTKIKVNNKLDVGSGTSASVGIDSKAQPSAGATFKLPKNKTLELGGSADGTKLVFTDGGFKLTFNAGAGSAEKRLELQYKATF